MIFLTIFEILLKDINFTHYKDKFIRRMNEAEKTSLDQSIIGIVDKAYEHRTPQ